MACPDELTLDLWLADALPPDEGSAISRHVETCAACAASVEATHALDANLHAALALDTDELAYIATVQLWRPAPAPWWGWIALVSVVAGFVAWLLVAPSFGSALGLALQVGIGSVLLNAVLSLVFTVGQAFLDVIRNPVLGWSQPLLALLALALLVSPRQLIPQRRTPA
jgi:anti-sigma factor RsiW